MDMTSFPKWMLVTHFNGVALPKPIPLSEASERLKVTFDQDTLIEIVPLEDERLDPS